MPVTKVVTSNKGTTITTTKSVAPATSKALKKGTVTDYTKASYDPKTKTYTQTNTNQTKITGVRTSDGKPITGYYDEAKKAYVTSDNKVYSTSNRNFTPETVKVSQAVTAKEDAVKAVTYNQTVKTYQQAPRTQDILKPEKVPYKQQFSDKEIAAATNNTVSYANRQGQPVPVPKPSLLERYQKDRPSFNPLSTITNAGRSEFTQQFVKKSFSSPKRAAAIVGGGAALVAAPVLLGAGVIGGLGAFTLGFAGASVISPALQKSGQEAYFKTKTGKELSEVPTVSQDVAKYQQDINSKGFVAQLKGGIPGYSIYNVKREDVNKAVLANIGQTNITTKQLKERQEAAYRGAVAAEVGTLTATIPTEVGGNVGGASFEFIAAKVAPFAARGTKSAIKGLFFRGIPKAAGGVASEGYASIEAQEAKIGSRQFTALEKAGIYGMGFLTTTSVDFTFKVGSTMTGTKGKTVRGLANIGGQLVDPGAETIGDAASMLNERIFSNPSSKLIFGKRSGVFITTTTNNNKNKVSYGIKDIDVKVPSVVSAPKSSSNLNQVVSDVFSQNQPTKSSLDKPRARTIAGLFGIGGKNPTQSPIDLPADDNSKTGNNVPISTSQRTSNRYFNNIINNAQSNVVNIDTRSESRTQTNINVGNSVEQFVNVPSVVPIGYLPPPVPMTLPNFGGGAVGSGRGGSRTYVNELAQVFGVQPTQKQTKKKKKQAQPKRVTPMRVLNPLVNNNQLKKILRRL